MQVPQPMPSLNFIYNLLIIKISLSRINQEQDFQVFS